MAFTDTQTKALKAKLNHRYVKAREQNGAALAYVEGWHVIAEANRIFGFDSWDRQTVAPDCVWSEIQRGQTVCFYSTKVRITVRAGGTVTIREGIGTGLGRSPFPEIAHEIALKGAETDATKRALSTFGNPFGLALYDRDQTHVTKPRSRRAGGSPSPMVALVLRTKDGREQSYAEPQEFMAALLTEVARIPTVDAVYAFWTAHLEALTELQRRTVGSSENPIEIVIQRLKGRLRELGGTPRRLKSETSPPPPPKLLEPELPLLAIPKEKRLRDKGHLAFVAGQPCLVCGRRPTQAHHLKFAQPTAMAMKVSDEFTLPLCATHHDQLHKTGDERAWWARNGIIEPLKFAARLWTASHQHGARENGVSEEVSHDVKADDPAADRAGGATGPDAGIDASP